MNSRRTDIGFHRSEVPARAARLYALYLLLAALTFGCSMGKTAAEVRMVKESESFTLAPGQRVQIGETVLRFDGVVSDSRCPVGVTCVWEGSATLRFIVESDNERTFTVETAERRGAPVGGMYQLVVESVTPVPHQGKTIAPSSYRATLVLQRLATS